MNEKTNVNNGKFDMKTGRFLTTLLVFFSILAVPVNASTHFNAHFGDPLKTEFEGYFEDAWSEYLGSTSTYGFAQPKYYD